MATIGKFTPNRGDMIWINYNPQASDKEMKDEHPMLVLSTRDFSFKTGLVIGLPMTTSARNEDNLFAVSFEQDGKKSYILTNLPKSFDYRERQARAHDWKCPAEVFQEACDRLNAIIQIG